MSGDVWFKFYASDWVAGVSSLSASERGVYVTLLAIMYDRGGPIPRDDARLSRQCGIPRHGFARCISALIDTGKILQEDGFIFNERAKSLLSERQIQKRNRSTVNKENVRSRWEKTKENQTPENTNRINFVSDSYENKIQIVTEPEPEPDKDKNLTVFCPKPVRTRNSYSEEFEVFWSGYPTDQNMSKKKAGQAFQKMTAESREMAIKSLPAFRRYCESHPDYRPVHAVKYLTDERFVGHAKTIEKLTASSFTVRQNSPQGKAWDEYSRATKGKGVPWTNGVWRFPSEYPPTPTGSIDDNNVEPFLAI